MAPGSDLKVISWIVLAWLGGAGCTDPAPRPLSLARDVCGHCHMTLEDRRFAGEIVFRTGKVTPFDDVGCLAIAAVGSALPIHSLWASDYLEPDSLVAVERLVFVRTGTVRTPMGYGIVAVRPGAAADSLARRFGTQPMSWNDVMAWARTEPR